MPYFQTHWMETDGNHVSVPPNLTNLTSSSEIVMLQLPNWGGTGCSDSAASWSSNFNLTAAAAKERMAKVIGVSVSVDFGSKNMWFFTVKVKTSGLPAKLPVLLSKMRISASHLGRSLQRSEVIYIHICVAQIRMVGR